VLYPEWDYRTGSYRERAVIVREAAAAQGDPDWAPAVLRRQARLLHTVCDCFARLRPRRARLRRQPDGAEVDIDAYVDGFANRAAGSPSDDGLYEDVRPRRRDVAVLLLIDCSASTDASIRGRERIIDIEKEALLLVCKALEAFGDRYAAYGFSGEAAHGVRVQPLKRFEDRYDGAVERRIAGLEPDRYTRLGAAVRHVTALLARERASRGLLLIVSDGKPNDVDEYEGRYGVEDARQAIVEARLQGLHPFCITVDRQAPRYARHIFGATGYTLLRDARMLPDTLLDLLRRLVTG
jgi:nitric oxide reductase NorD protein